MAAPGFSVSELIKAIDTISAICESFGSRQNSARKRVQELADTICVFKGNLKDQQWILETTGRHYPGHEGFASLLEECSEFIQKYRAVLEPQGTAVSVAERIFRTAIWPTDEQRRVDRLLRMLNLHVQASNMFTLNLLMQV